MSLADIRKFESFVVDKKNRTCFSRRLFLRYLLLIDFLDVKNIGIRIFSNGLFSRRQERLGQIRFSGKGFLCRAITR